MKPEDRSNEIVLEIMETCNCSKEEAIPMASKFVERLIHEIKKFQYYQVGPQVVYWETVALDLEKK